MVDAQEISLYFHIPFCTKKCPYCHFFVLPDKDPFKKQLMNGLALEWHRWKPHVENKELISIYFGGGTPALLGPDPIHEILSWIRKAFAFDPSVVEVTLEANPENVTFDLMKSYLEGGINRVSMGIQTLDDQLLQKLGRTHSSQKALEALELASQAGIYNLSIDLMYDLPGQELSHWHSTLSQLQALPISHLSLYNLTIETHTAFFKYREKLRQELPNEEVSLEMYETAVQTLEKIGLNQYEISAFAKKGAISKHNTGYWKGRPFIGLGPSAFSYWEGKRFRNVAHLQRYTHALNQHQSPVDFEEKLADVFRRRELLAIQLRMVEGVDLERFQQKNGQFDDETHASLCKLAENHFIQYEPSHVALTKKGILFYDLVASEIV